MPTLPFKNSLCYDAPQVGNPLNQHLIVERIQNEALYYNHHGCADNIICSLF